MPKAQSLLPLSRLRTLFDCDCARGTLTFRPRTPADFKPVPRLSAVAAAKAFATRHAGKIAGRSDSGRRRVNVDGCRFWAYRVIFALCSGRDPGEARIDHRNGDSADDAYSNLRPASHAENIRNAKLRKDNATGARGVFFVKRTGRYAASIHVDGKTHSLGGFATLDEAKAARVEAERRLFGEFAPSLSRPADAMSESPGTK
ncbi:HNH endonuclease [Methylosinus sp. H3A]|uniref:HNH endonuclease n=1 Tax=Methylosinus sp. H3A TaxID=2785786 RepID=UPI0018C23ECF|nr:HNH endonuclease [Methylosinus sp. H3A]MBG0811211.1 HNH endonuclease [Methylosinus sp. H3A]